MSSIIAACHRCNYRFQDVCIIDLMVQVTKAQAFEMTVLNQDSAILAKVSTFVYYDDILVL